MSTTPLLESELVDTGERDRLLEEYRILNAAQNLLIQNPNRVITTRDITRSLFGEDASEDDALRVGDALATDARARDLMFNIKTAGFALQIGESITVDTEGDEIDRSGAFRVFAWEERQQHTLPETLQATSRDGRVRRTHFQPAWERWPEHDEAPQKRIGRVAVNPQPAVENLRPFKPKETIRKREAKVLEAIDWEAFSDDVEAEIELLADAVMPRDGEPLTHNEVMRRKRPSTKLGTEKTWMQLYSAGLVDTKSYQGLYTARTLVLEMLIGSYRGSAFNPANRDQAVREVDRCLEAYFAKLKEQKHQPAMAY